MRGMCQATSRSLLAAVLVLVASAGFADAACNITAVRRNRGPVARNPFERSAGSHGA